MGNIVFGTADTMEGTRDFSRCSVQPCTAVREVALTVEGRKGERAVAARTGNGIDAQPSSGRQQLDSPRTTEGARRRRRRRHPEDARSTEADGRQTHRRRALFDGVGPSAGGDCPRAHSLELADAARRAQSEQRECGEPARSLQLCRAMGAA